MGDTKKPKRRKTVQIEVIKCQHCGRLAVALGPTPYRMTRITGHKCAGAWTTVLSESVDSKWLDEQLVEAIHGC